MSAKNELAWYLTGKIIKKGSTICPTSEIVCFSGIYFYVFPHKKLRFFLWTFFRYPDLRTYQFVSQSGTTTSIAKFCWCFASSMWCDTRLCHIPDFPILKLPRSSQTYELTWLNWLYPHKPTSSLLPFCSYQSTYWCAKHTYSNIWIDILQTQQNVRPLQTILSNSVKSVM